MEPVNGGAGFPGPVVGEFPFEAGLGGEEVFVGAGEFLGLVRGEIEVGIVNNECATGQVGLECLGDIGLESEGGAVEAKVVIPGEAGREERIVETADPGGETEHFFVFEVVAQEGAVEPDGVFGEIAALVLSG